MPARPDPEVSCMLLRSLRLVMPFSAPGPRSYGGWVARVQSAILLALALAFAAPNASAAAEKPVRIVALGDSLTAGYGLPADAAFPAKLQKALKAKGLAVEVANAGVSGDTASRGLDRLDWGVPPGPEAVIVGVGGDDMV